jgi:hypothetical protein
VLPFLTASTLIAQDAKVTPLMSKVLADFPGKEGLMITVVYPPGASDPIHGHNAHAFLYVLEGSVVMQLKDGIEITLKPRHMKVPNDIHPQRRPRPSASSASTCTRRASPSTAVSNWSGFPKDREPGRVRRGDVDPHQQTMQPRQNRGQP